MLSQRRRFGSRYVNEDRKKRGSTSSAWSSYIDVAVDFVIKILLGFLQVFFADPLWKKKFRAVHMDVEVRSGGDDGLVEAVHGVLQAHAMELEGQEGRLSGQAVKRETVVALDIYFYVVRCTEMRDQAVDGDHRHGSSAIPDLLGTAVVPVQGFEPLGGDRADAVTLIAHVKGSETGGVADGGMDNLNFVTGTHQFEMAEAIG